LEELDVDVRIILKWVFEEKDLRTWTGFIWVRTGTSRGPVEGRNELRGSIKYSEFLDKLRNK